MTPEQLDSYLRTPTEHEKLYREGWENLRLASNMRTVLVRGRSQRVMDLSGVNMPPLSGGKHSRFSAYPTHIHPWVELCYLYSGSCEQVINDDRVSMRPGQMVMLDQNTVHSLPVMGENDILLNIYVSKPYLTAQFFNRISQKNVVSQFFIDSVTEGLAHDRYLFFASENSRRLPIYITEFFCELYDPGDCSQDILASLFTLVLTEMIRSYQAGTPQRGQDSSHVLDALRYIERNYASISLQQMAAHFGLNPNYLSNLLKSQTGSSFRALVQKQRMVSAKHLLLNSSLPVCEVSARVGYENTAFFYKKFEQEYGCRPSEYRQVNGKDR